MVSFTDHYNAIYIDRLSWETKIEKDSLYFNISPLCRPESFSATKTFFIKNTKKNSRYQTSDWSIYTKSCFKENAKIFSKKSTTAFFNKKLKKTTTL